VVVNLFGESMEDRRDYRMGLAGLLAGIHALRILAEQGLANTSDIALSVNGVRDVLDTIPEDAWRAGEREKLDQMLINVINSASPLGGRHG
jgi:hypothetical protein